MNTARGTGRSVVVVADLTVNDHNFIRRTFAEPGNNEDQQGKQENRGDSDQSDDKWRHNDFPPIFL